MNKGKIIPLKHGNKKGSKDNNIIIKARLIAILNIRRHGSHECKSCKHTFDCIKKFQKHIYDCLPAGYRCNNCYMIFYNKYELKIHKCDTTQVVRMLNR